VAAPSSHCDPSRAGTEKPEVQSSDSLEKKYSSSPRPPSPLQSLHLEIFAVLLGTPLDEPGAGGHRRMLDVEIFAVLFC
jgi:hypothetical protein